MNRASLAAPPLALLLLAYAPRASAQTAGAATPPPPAEPQYALPTVRPVPVSIQVEQGISLDVVAANDTTIATLSDRCNPRCRSTLPPGTYTLRARDAATGDLIGERTVDVDRPSDFRTFRPDSAAKGLGMAMAITGHVVSMIGTSVFLLDLGLSGMCNNPSCQSHSGMLYGGLAALGGAGLSSLGWYVFAKNRNWLDQPEAEPAPTKTGPTVSVGAAPLPGGAALAGSVSF
jgi:hypothetical protein